MCKAISCQVWKNSKTFIFVLFLSARYFHVKWNQFNPLLLLFNLSLPYDTANLRRCDFLWIHHRRLLNNKSINQSIVLLGVYLLFTVVLFNRYLEVEQLAVWLYRMSSKNKIITCLVPDYQFHITLIKWFRSFAAKILRIKKPFINRSLATFKIFCNKQWQIWIAQYDKLRSKYLMYSKPSFTPLKQHFDLMLFWLFVEIKYKKHE